MFPKVAKTVKSATVREQSLEIEMAESANHNNPAKTPDFIGVVLEEERGCSSRKRNCGIVSSLLVVLTIGICILISVSISGEGKAHFTT